MSHAALVGGDGCHINAKAHRDPGSFCRSWVIEQEALPLGQHGRQAALRARTGSPVTFVR
jgi:hypothetical protein